MQDTAVTKSKPLIIREELTPDEQQTLMQDLLAMVIVVNLMVLVSIIFCA